METSKINCETDAIRHANLMNDLSCAGTVGASVSGAVIFVISNAVVDWRHLYILCLILIVFCLAIICSLSVYLEIRQGLKIAGSILDGNAAAQRSAADKFWSGDEEMTEPLTEHSIETVDEIIAEHYEKFRGIIAESSDESAASAAESVEAQNRVQTSRALVAEQLRAYWKRVTVAEILVETESELSAAFYDESSDNNSAGRQSGRAFRWFCICAVQFYRAKGSNIRHLKAAELIDRLVADGFYDEFFFDHWTYFFSHKTAEIAAAETLRMISLNAGREQFAPTSFMAAASGASAPSAPDADEFSDEFSDGFSDELLDEFSGEFSDEFSDEIFEEDNHRREAHR